MRVLYYDCFAGISGDMNLGALVDLGVDKAALAAQLKLLKLGGWELSFEKDARSGICGTRAQVHLEHAHAHHGHTHHEHRSFADIKRLIEGSALSPRVKETAIKIFQTLAEAEAQVHGKTPDEVHFHEVGAVDSIIDIVGAAICLDLLKIEKIACSSVELGGGTVRCAHGVLPVPAPATALLAKKFLSSLNGAPHECTTPTGAAILAALGDEFNAPVSGKMLATGIGVGQRDCPELPNILRVTLYETEEIGNISHERLVELRANIDDMNAEHLALLCEHLFEAGALDVWQTPIVMKKGRLATQVCALGRLPAQTALTQCFFTHGTTLGVRVYYPERASIERESVELKTSLGVVRFKKSFLNGQTRLKPECDDIAALSRQTGIPADRLARKLLDEVENG